MIEKLSSFVEKRSRSVVLIFSQRITPIGVTAVSGVVGKTLTGAIFWCFTAQGIVGVRMSYSHFLIQ